MKPSTSRYVFSLDSKPVSLVETRYRRIRTAIPHPEDVRTIREIMSYESEFLNRELPIVWDRAEGFLIYDLWGNQWLDMSSTIFVANSGHANPKIKGRLKDVVEKGLLHAYCYPTREREALLKVLIGMTPDYLERAILVCTGTEASERAIKTARIYGMTFSPRKKVIVGGAGNFHGKTMGAMMAATSPQAREWIGTQDPYMYQLPFPYPWLLEKENISGKDLFERDITALVANGLKPEEVAAFIIESYQGWGAVFYPTDYVHAMSTWAKEYNALIIADEIQAGFGRTGKLFGYQHYGIEPDLVCCGKGLSGSLPLAALIGRSDLVSLDPTLTSTHGGHPAACAAATGNLEAITENGFIERAEEIGDLLHEMLILWQNDFPERILRISGAGLVWAVFIGFPGTNELDADFADRLVERAMQKGVFSIRTGCGTIKLGPPLSIEVEALREAIGVYREGMRELIEEGH